MTRPAARTVPALLDELAVACPDAEALVGGAERLSFAGLRDRARALAGSLAALGVRKGDRIAILMGNRAEWVLTDLAALSLGAVVVGVNTWSTTRELHYTLAHSRASVLVAADRFLKADYLAQLDEQRPWTDTLPALRHVVVVGDGARADMVPFAAFAAAGTPPGDAGIEPDDLAHILYTSGSTSLPKGVMLLHGSLVGNLWDIGDRLGVRAGDRLWLAVSLFWGLGCSNALFAALTHRACVVLQESFDPGEALRLMEAERCTVLYGTPNMVSALICHPDFPSRDVSSMRAGAAIGTPGQMRAVMRDLVPQACQIYGLTETYGNCAVGDWRDPDEVRAASVGRVLPGSEFRVVDPATGAAVPPGAPGELRVRGHVTPGYYNDPVQTAAAFDADGFFRTGDLCVLDADGRLSFRNRLKEMLKTGGINVSPAEVEDVLNSHMAVEQAHVIGLPDPVRDEVVAAVVVLKPGAAATEAELLTHCRRELAAYKVPRRLVIVPSRDLPLTVTGKVQKNRLAALFG